MKPNPKYNEEFKLRAVKMLRNTEKTAVQIARELGCSADTLRHWKRKYDDPLEDCPDPEALTPEQLRKENQRLQKELDYVTEQREILKKAAAILGR